MAEKEVKTIYEKYRRYIEGMIEGGKREGSIGANVDPALYAHVIIAAHTGMLVQWFVNDESLDVGAFVRTFRDFILRGINDAGAK